MSPEEINVIGSEDEGLNDVTVFAERSASALTGGASISGRRHSSILKGNLGLMVMFAVGIGCVYLLSLRKGPAAASADQQTAELQVDDALTRLGKSGLTPLPGQAKASSLVNTFYLQAKQRQIPLDQLARNPFTFTQPGPIEPVVKKVEKEPVEEDKAGQALEEAVAEARLLSLQSILSGSAGATAMISNNLLTEGQKIGSWTLSKIRSNDVVLTWKEHEYVLKMPK